MISEVQAQTAPAGGAPTQGFDPVGLLPLAVVAVLFYFMIIRPQNKKQKDHHAMLQAIKRGDHILTNAGIYGTVTEIQGESDLEVEIAPGVVVRVARHMVHQLQEKPEGGKVQAITKKKAK